MTTNQVNKPGEPPQLSHDELRQALVRHDWQSAVGQLKRAERKRQDTVSYPDPKQAEWSAGVTSNMVTEYLSRYLPAGIATSTGGEKGAERAYGTAAERAASECSRIEWYANQVQQALAKNGTYTDDAILKLPDRPRRLSGRTLRRLKGKHSALLQKLLAT